MKRAVIVALMLVMMMGLGTGSASAANSLKAGTIGLNFDVNNDFMLSGKYFFTNDIAMLAGFGLGAKGGDGSGTDVAILGGVRKYLKVDDFAPFVGGLFEYRSTLDSTQKDLSLMAVAGAEYFLGKQFSIEGSIGFGYSQNETETTTTTGGPFPTVTKTTYKETNIGTQRAGLSANFYF